METARLFFDIEADGLLDSLSQVHCLSVSDGGEPVLFVGDSIPEGLALLASAGEVVGHNIIGYDLIALWRVYGWRPAGKVVDTFVLSTLVHPDIYGGHSLEAWGERVGCEKMDYLAAYLEWRKQSDPDYRYSQGDEWAAYNEVMGEYCQQDVRTLVRVHERLRADMLEWEKLGHSWAKAEWMEHEFAKLFAVQGIRGVAVDVPHVRNCFQSWTEEMHAIEREVEPMLPLRDGTKGQLDSWRPPKLCFKKDGTPSAATLSWFDKVSFTDGLGTDVEPGDPCGVWAGLKDGEWHNLPTPMEDDGSKRKPLKTEFPMRLSDQEALKSWLMASGWVPTMWSYKKAKDKHGKLRIVRGDDGKPVPSQPKFHEKGTLCKNLESISSTFPHVQKAVRWIVVRHRVGFMQGILDALREDGTVPATGIPLGTPTSRVAHSAPVANIPKAEPSVVYGVECRSAFIARPGNVLVGVDAAGLELRCLASRVGNPDLVEMVTKGKAADKEKGEPPESGTDVHTRLWLACRPLVKTRSDQKNVVYGFIYGASDAKLGQTAGHPDSTAKAIGETLRARLIAGIPGLEELMRKVQAAAKRGWIRALDGRRIPIRSPHSALNTILQSDGSILVKWATVYMSKELRRRHLPAIQVIHYHDEVVLDSDPTLAEEAGGLFVEGLRWAGERLGFRCPLDGGVKIGGSWAEIH